MVHRSKKPMTFSSHHPGYAAAELRIRADWEPAPPPAPPYDPNNLQIWQRSEVDDGARRATTGQPKPETLIGTVRLHNRSVSRPTHILTRHGDDPTALLERVRAK